MKKLRQKRSLALVLIAMLGIVAGCATPKIDWNSRVGKITFDEVVVDMGPPDRQAKLQNGVVVAEWLTRRSSRTLVLSGYYGADCFYPHYFAPVPLYTDYQSPDHFLRLTFNADGRLHSWKNIRR